QNEELRRTQAELEESRARYSDLYDFAPVGYLTFDAHGLILEANLTAARQLGLERGYLINKPFHLFLAQPDRETFKAHLQAVFKTRERQTCEVRLAAKSGEQFCARLESIFVEGSDGAGRCRTSVIDLNLTKRAEEERRRLEEQRRLAQEAANAGSWEWDLRTNENFWSEELWKLYGLEPHSCRPSYEAWCQTIHPQDRPAAVQAVQEAARNGSELNAEWRVLDPDGSERWLLSRGKPIRDADGDMARFIGIVMDITYRKRIEKELRDAHDELEIRVRERTAELSAANRELAAEVTERKRVQAVLSRSEERFRSLVTATSQMVWTTDPKGEVVEDIPTWRAFTGQSEQEVNGWGWIEALHPKDRLQTAEIWNQAVQSKTYYETEYRVRRPDGEYRLFRARGIPILEDDGTIREWVGTCTDITEERLSEKRLQRNVELLQTVVDGIGDPLIMLDKDGLVKMVNKAARDYYGAAQDMDAFGKPCFEGLRGRKTACPDCHYPFGSVDRQTVAFERKGLTDAGKVERVTLYPVINESDQRDGIILKITDVTQAKFLERQIIQNEKLAALGLVTSGIAHEINNPNSFIAFNIPILRQYLDALMPILDEYAALHPDFEVFHMSFGELKEDMSKLLGNMEHGSQRINRIVGTLTSFVRKRDKEGLQRFDLKALIDRVVALCHAQIRRTVKSFEVLIPESLPPIFSSSDALEQVLLNLLINAVHACDKEDSRIRLEVGRGCAGNDAFMIEISDNGSG
ncbi:MAG: PAS domain S-box protein, partial [Syntrophobacteraceae bacterium]|nr:PAS domain S-box protein [Syntrophobacteraceae bacterium]